MGRRVKGDLNDHPLLVKEYNCFGGNSMKKILYLVRHGETVNNTKGITNGVIDSELTDKGIQQAKLAGKWLKDNGVDFDHVYVSCLGRAQKTCNLITDKPFKIERGLRERSFGKYEGQGPEFRKYMWQDLVSLGGAEDVCKVAKRMDRTLRRVMEKQDNNIVLAVSHSAAIRIFTYYHMDDAKAEIPVRIPNCAILVYEYEDGKFSLVNVVDVEK